MSISPILCFHYRRRQAFVSMKGILLVLAVLLPLITLADNGNQDSLQRIIKYSRYNIAKADALVALSEIEYTSNIDSVIPLCTEAVDLLDSDISDSSAKANSRKLFIKAHALNNIGAVYYQKGILRKAIDFYLAGLKLRDSLGDKEGMAESYNNLGVVYKSQGGITQAIDYYRKSLELYRETGNLQGQATATGNIGSLFASENKKDTASAYFSKMYLLEDSGGNTEGMVKALYNTAVIYQTEGKYTEALEICFQSLDLLGKIDDDQDKADILYLIADLEYFTNNFPKADEYGRKALKAYQDMGFPDNILSAAHLLYRLYNDEKKWKDALEMYLIYSSMHDSVNNTETRRQIIQKGLEYEYARKEDQNRHEQEKRELLQTAESKREKLATILAVLIAVSAAIIASLVFRSLKTTRKQKGIIEEQKLLVEEKNKDILDSITYAKRLQDAILPPMSLIEHYFPESFVLYKPKDIVAGDFYWLAPLPPEGGSKSSPSFDSKIPHSGGRGALIAACDCTGHGVPGALVSVVCSNALNRAVKEFHITDPGKILDKVRELVMETFATAGEVRDGMDVSLCCIDRATGTILWSGANNPLLYVQNGTLAEIRPDKQPVGKFEIDSPFTTHTVPATVTSLYLFSDGFSDQFGGPNGKKFKYARLKQTLLAISGRPMHDQKELLEKEFTQWQGNLQQTDDVCVIGISLV